MAGSKTALTVMALVIVFGAIAGALGAYYFHNKEKRSQAVSSTDEASSTSSAPRTWPRAVRRLSRDLEHAMTDWRASTALTGWNIPASVMYEIADEAAQASSTALPPSSVQDLPAVPEPLRFKDHGRKRVRKLDPESINYFQGTSSQEASWEAEMALGRSTSEIKRGKRAETLAMLEGSTPMVAGAEVRGISAAAKPTTRLGADAVRYLGQKKVQIQAQRQSLIRNGNEEQSSFLPGMLGNGEVLHKFSFETD